MTSRSLNTDFTEIVVATTLNLLISALPEIADFTLLLPVKGSELELECVFRGIPRPDITWMKNSIILSSNDRLAISATTEGVSSVRIESFSPEDSGVYSCTASSIAGSVSKAIAVTFNDEG